MRACPPCATEHAAVPQHDAQAEGGAHHGALRSPGTDEVAGENRPRPGGGGGKAGRQGRDGGGGKEGAGAGRTQ